MTTIRRLLVPTDGSEGALRAAAVAGDFARALDAHVLILLVLGDELVMPHAWGPGDYPANAPWGKLSIEQVRADIERQAWEKALPDTIAALGELDQSPDISIVWGRPAAEIARHAKEQAVDLIVIGSHGRTGLKRALLGSVSHAVANDAPCPVTIVR
ncbi:MAG: universal stress protein [Pseudomonadales bacterium]|nr:universal stress protein [Pseudomonadales bacterium]MCP5184973.1 universal stress protein [Pseudomonadales bacterium]